MRRGGDREGESMGETPGSSAQGEGAWERQGGRRVQCTGEDGAVHRVGGSSAEGRRVQCRGEEGAVHRRGWSSAQGRREQCTWG